MPKKSLMSLLKRLAVIAIIMALFLIAAFSSGVGYEPNVHITSQMPFVNPNNPGLYGDLIVTGDVNVSLNGFLYPISYASGNGQVQSTFNITFRRPSQRGYIPADVIEEAVMLRVLSPEITKNLPYFFVFALVIELVLERFVNVLMKPFRLKEKPIEPT